jgi:hypothetical protein
VKIVPFILLFSFLGVTVYLVCGTIALLFFTAWMGGFATCECAGTILRGSIEENTARTPIQV